MEENDTLTADTSAETTDETKVKSFRISEKTSEQFRMIAQNMGGNQQETLAKLIEVYELQQGKQMLSGRTKEIEQFEKYISCITRLYIGLIEDNHNTQETIYAQYEGLIASKDDEIASLKAENEKLTSSLKEVKDNYRNINAKYEKNEKILNEFKEARNSESMQHITALAAKDQLIEKYQKDAITYQAKSEELSQDIRLMTGELDKLRMTNNGLNNSIRIYEDKLDLLQQQLEDEKKHSSELSAKIGQMDDDFKNKMKSALEEATLHYDNQLLKAQMEHKQESLLLEETHQKEMKAQLQKYMELAESKYTGNKQTEK